MMYLRVVGVVSSRCGGWHAVPHAVRRGVGGAGTQWLTQEFFRWGGSKNSVEDRGEREWGSGGVAP